MSGINQVILVGRIGRDPESHDTAGGKMTFFSMATSRRFKGADGQSQEETEWHSIVAFGNTAEVVTKYLKKGDLVYVNGRLRTRKYTDKQGVERYKTEIICNQMQMLGAGMKNENPKAVAEEDVLF